MIIVFGAAGFIGTYLIHQLIKESFKVLVVDIDESGAAYYDAHKIPFMFVDITKEEDFDKLPKDAARCIINLACLQPANVSKEEDNPRNYIKVNVLGMLNILEFARKTGTPKIIYTMSHRAVQGFWQYRKPVSEKSTKAIKYSGEYAMYSISESAAADCVQYYSKQYGMHTIIFRLPPVYGYGPHLEGFRNGKPIKTGFQVFIDNAMAGRPIELWGDCEKGRDIIYVKDVVSALILALKNGKTKGLYNIASGKLLSLKEEAQEIIKVFSPKDRPSELVYRPNIFNSIEYFLYDISKAKKDLHWCPKYSFIEMLFDYKREMENDRFGFLLEKRRHMMTDK